jgi:hypothetical protein
MTSMAWRTVDLVSTLLERDEREAVRGDLAEAGTTAMQGLCDVLGLVIRRQALLWKSWRPWLAAFGIALPGSLLFMGFSLTVSRGYRLIAWIIENHQFIDPELLRQTGLAVGPAISELLWRTALLTARAWTAGFVVGSMSRRTVWVSAALSFFACGFCFVRFHDANLSRFCLLLFLLPASWGAWRGLRTSCIKLSSAIALAAVVTVLTVSTWTTSGWWILSWAQLWPAWYLVGAAAREPEYAG